jgi:CHAT domain-containing protein
MGYRNLSLSAFIALMLTIFLPVTANLPALFQMSPVLAQTTNERKAEAERLYQQGDRQGEALSLNYIAIVQRTLGDYIQALEFYKQALDIFRELGDRLNEGTVLNNITLIVGNPTMPFISPKIGEKPQQLTPLPGAQKEAQAIAKLLKTQPLIGSKATEAAVIGRLPQARFVHLATHGIFDDIQGLNSGIALAPNSSGSKGNEKSDGLLTGAEIIHKGLAVRLVVRHRTSLISQRRSSKADLQF